MTEMIELGSKDVKTAIVTHIQEVKGDMNVMEEEKRMIQKTPELNMQRQNI